MTLQERGRAFIFMGWLLLAGMLLHVWLPLGLGFVAISLLGLGSYIEMRKP